MTKPIDNPFDFGPDKKNELRLFSDELLNKFKGKMVEIYIGDQASTLNFDDHSIPENCTIFGKLVDVLDRFIILECLYIDKKTGNVKTGNSVYVNAFQIRAMTELDTFGSLYDIFLNARDAHHIRKQLLATHGKTSK
jgi:hypothetical protein